MIIEALLAHVIGSFYFRSQKSHYTWGVLFTYFVIQVVIDSNHYLEWLIFSLGLMVWHGVYEGTLKPSIHRFLDTIRLNEQHPLFSLYMSNKQSVLFLIDHALTLLWLLLLQNLTRGFDTIVPILLFVLFVLVLLYKISRNFRDYRWRRVLQEGATLLILASLTIIVSDLIIHALEVYRPYSLPPHVFAAQSAYFIWVRGALVLALLMRPANEVIRTLSSKYDPKVRHRGTIQGTGEQIQEEKQEAGFKGAGAMIGNLERLLILISFFFGSLVSVVAILSIKAFARYKLIAEDPYFSEYFVIGTMLSVLLTLGCYVLFLILVV